MKLIHIKIYQMIIVLSSFSILSISATHQSNTSTPSFIGSVYPTSPMHAIRAKTMYLWSKVHDASVSSQAKEQFINAIDTYLTNLLDIYALVATVPTEAKNSYDQQDIQALQKLMLAIQTLSEPMSANSSEKALLCFPLIADYCAKKIERMI